jgi:signal transduction histidine kinase
VPIRAGDQTFGVIHIDSSLINFTFAPEQLRLMNAIGQHTGLALKSAAVLSSKMQTERLAAMGETVASLSHSIKNILQGLRGGADAVELAINKSDLQLAKEGWPILARNLDRIYALTLNMLAYSKHRDLEIELISLHKLIEEATELMQPQCERKRAGLILDLADDMPPIPADSNALHQALMNLLTNALEAVPEKKGVITVATRFVHSSNEAQITVSDNGPGIEPEWREHIFEAFTSTKGQRGTGLGLAVTRKIIAEHGGRIELNAHTVKGATFTITLPSDRAGLDPGDTKLPRPLSSSQLDLVDEFEE